MNTGAGGAKSSQVMNAAKVIAQAHKIDYATAYHITNALYTEARAAIARAVNNNAALWKSLPMKEKAAICQAVVKALLDRDNIVRYLSGDKKTLI